jgi:(R,R)-butanediol dehydrogenase / meso-butanediol dehydrogenase / diacetyl reductase
MRAALYYGPGDVRLEHARRAVAASLGAAEVLDPASTDAVAAVLERTRGAGAGTVIDAAGTAESFRTGLALTGRRGRFVTLAAYAEPVRYHPTQVMMREIEIVSSFSSCGELAAVLGHMQAGRYALGSLDRWVERVPFERQLDAYGRLHRGEAMKLLIDVGASTG